MERTIIGAPYIPSSPRSGETGDFIYRMQNLFKRGKGSQSYWECYGGSEDLSETVANTALTGTIALTSGSNVAIGTGTLFTTELHLGQFVLIVDGTIHRSFLCVVEEITSNTSLKMSQAYTFTGTVAGKTGYRLPILCALNDTRVSMLRGNVIGYDNGTLFSVGDGEVKFNGASLSAALNATRKPQVSRLSGTYTHASLGLPEPARPTVTTGTLSVSAATNASPVSITSNSHGLVTGQRVTLSGATGSWTPINGVFVITKTGTNTFTIPVDSTGFGALTGTVVVGSPNNMQGTTYGILVTAERIETVGYGNPSEVTTITIATGDLVKIDFGAMDSTSKQNAWGVWVTRYVDGQDTLGKNYLNGPWFRLLAGSGNNGQVIAADLTGTAIRTSWLDGEVEGNDKITFDNDPPPDAEFIDLFNNVPVLISCVGPGDTSPGIRIYPAKPSNVEAYPSGLAYSTSPSEIILGVVSANGKLYLLTPNHLQVTVGTGNDVLPVVIQPHWKSGFKNPYQVDVVNKWVYGCTTAGPSRSIGEGDEIEADRSWAWPITEFSKNWTIGHMTVRHDPQTDSMCFIESAHSLNASGFWTSRIWAYGITESEWNEVLLTSTTGDMIVSGVATVGDHLEFICGGRQSDDSVVCKTYRFDTATGVSVPYYLAASFSDSGQPQRPKRIGPGVQVNGKITNGAAKVYGAASTNAIPVSDLESGSNPLVTLTLSNDAGVIEGARQEVNISNQKLHTIRIGGTWPGTGDRDRIESFGYEHGIEGARR